MIRRALFVDDEPRVLSGLRRLLRPLRHEWEMHFVASGPEALDLLRAHDFHVVVADLRMPEMDGATLLRMVRERDPETLRVVLSAQADEESTLRTVPVAHVYLAKPSTAEELASVLERARRLDELLDNDDLRRVVGDTSTLPPVPAVHAELDRLLRDDTAPIERVASVVESDPTILSAVLRLANSGFFARARPVTNVSEALSFLGLTTLRHLVLGAGVFHAFDAEAVDPALLRREQDHSLAVGRVARAIGAGLADPDDAFAAGMLHDLGRLLIDVRLPDMREAIAARVRDSGCPRHEAERALLGTSHAEAGALLLEVWGIPRPVVEAVARHHAPRPHEGERVSLAHIVHFADRLVHESDPHPDHPAAPVEAAELEPLGLGSRLAAWREAVALALPAEEAVS